MEEESLIKYPQNDQNSLSNSFGGVSFGTFSRGGLKTFALDPEKLKIAAALFGDT